MPYYLAPYIGAGTRADPFRPHGSDQPGWAAVDLRPNGGATRDGSGLNAAWLYLPVHDPSPQLVQVATEKLEELGPLVRSTICSRLGLSASSFTRLDELIAESLLTPPSNGWNRLQPTPRGMYEVYLGGLLWNQLLIAGGSQIDDSFNRANGNLDGSTSSDGQFVWSEFSGTGITVLTNRANATGTVGFTQARAQFDLASGDMYAQAIVPTLTGSSSKSAEVTCRMTSASGDQYIFIVQGIGGAGDTEHVLRKTVAGVDTDLGTDAIDWAANETIKVEANGSAIRGYRNGAVLIGPITDTALANTRKRGGINIFCNIGASVVDMDDFQAADLVVRIPYQPHYQRAPMIAQ